MRTTSLRLVAGSAATFNWTVFPNGRVFNATDVFAGSAQLHRIRLSNQSSTGKHTVAVTVYDLLNASTNRVIVGGSAAPLDAYRVMAKNGAGTLATSSGGDPWINEAPGAQVTPGRKLIDTFTYAIDASIPTDGLELPFENVIAQMGLVVAVTAVAGDVDTFSLALEWTPLVTGATRMRRSYPAGSTTKALPLAIGTAPL